MSITNSKINLLTVNHDKFRFKEKEGDMADIQESIRVGLHLTKTSNGDIACALNVSLSTVSLWRNNKRRINWEYIVKLAEFFDVSVSTFIEWGS